MHGGGLPWFLFGYSAPLHFGSAARYAVRRNWEICCAVWTACGALSGRPCQHPGEEAASSCSIIFGVDDVRASSCGRRRRPEIDTWKQECSCSVARCSGVASRQYVDLVQWINQDLGEVLESRMMAVSKLTVPLRFLRPTIVPDFLKFYGHSKREDKTLMDPFDVPCLPRKPEEDDCQKRRNCSTLQ